MNKYSVLVVGMGKRGMHHATAFNANPRFQVAGICDIDPKRLADAAGKLGNPQTGTDAAALAKTIHPDVFCFCTMPHLRTPFIRAAIDGGANISASTRNCQGRENFIVGSVQASMTALERLRGRSTSTPCSRAM